MTRAATSRATVGSALLCALALAAFAATGCGTTRAPEPIGASELAEAQTFPYYRIYWAGPTFQGEPLVAADGRKSYNISVGDSVYYGDCARGHGVFGGGGSCQLPLQVTTVIYRLHSNSALGPQRNMFIRGVPATVYDEGRSIELYSGRVAIDIFSDAFSHARAAALQLRPLNAPGSATAPLPPPVYCPGLYGPQEPRLRHAMAHLPGHACQTAAAEVAFAGSLRMASSSSSTSASVSRAASHPEIRRGAAR
ncbi:MAG TPA: hypothetical protein VGH60_03430 [Solirubrobacteraceae bacterium]|jgi:hypothetical protein